MKRETLTDQVGKQAVTIEALRTKLSETKADFAVLERSYEVALDNNHGLNELVIELRSDIDGKVMNLSEAHAKITKLEAEVKSKDSQYTYAHKRAETAEAEIEQAHATLDILPEAVPKEFEKEYGKGKHSLSARFMGTIVACVRSTK